MRRPPPGPIFDPLPIARIRKAIRRCEGLSHAHSISALLRIRRDEFKTRTIDGPVAVGLGAILLVFLAVNAIRMGLTPATIAISVAAAILTIIALAHFHRLYPNRDELDKRERIEIDSIVRFALDSLAERVDLSDVVLDNEDRSELLDIYRGQDLPFAYRQLLLKEMEASLMPDV
jgi:hypothetical protein